MGTIIVIGILLGIGEWLFEQGKRTGSRGGFRAGWSKGRDSIDRPK